MKSAVYLLAIFLSSTLASDAVEVEPAEYQQIVPSQQDFYQDLWNMSPGERERLGINFNRDMPNAPFDSMVPMNSNPWMNDMMMMMGPMQGMNMMGPMQGMNMMGYPGYNMNNNMMYPGYNQMNRMSSSCGCQQLCPPCYLPWMCIPCQCPCQTTTPPSDSEGEPTTSPTTTTSSTTTTTTTTTPSTTTTQEISTCVPCTNPCNPCGPIWMPWIPCNNVCICNNGCQTVTPAPLIASTTALPSASNCQCDCAPCPPFGHCPPCPRNCPCK